MPKVKVEGVEIDMSRNVKWGLAALAVALHLVGTAALGQPPTGTRIDPAPGAVGNIEGEDEVTAARVMNTFARCIARDRRRGAQALLRLPQRSPEQNAAARRLVGGEEDCLGRSGGRLVFQPPLLAGGIAEQLILDRHRDSDPARLMHLSNEELSQAGLAPRNAYEDLAQCIVRRDPVAVRELISTEPRDSEEYAVFARIIPHLQPCVPAGRTIEFGRSALRTLLAVSLYRMLSAVDAREARN